MAMAKIAVQGQYRRYLPGTDNQAVYDLNKFPRENEDIDRSRLNAKFTSL